MNVFSKTEELNGKFVCAMNGTRSLHNVNIGIASLCRVIKANNAGNGLE